MLSTNTDRCNFRLNTRGNGGCGAFCNCVVNANGIGNSVVCFSLSRISAANCTGGLAHSTSTIASFNDKTAVGPVTNAIGRLGGEE